MTSHAAVWVAGDTGVGRRGCRASPLMHIYGVEMKVFAQMHCPSSPSSTQGTLVSFGDTNKNCIREFLEGPESRSLASAHTHLLHEEDPFPSQTFTDSWGPQPAMFSPSCEATALAQPARTAFLPGGPEVVAREEHSCSGQAHSSTALSEPPGHLGGNVTFQWLAPGTRLGRQQSLSWGPGGEKQPH